MKRPRSSQAISPTGMRFPPSNLLPLIISVASPTPSHPLLFLYWHCHRHRTCPSPHPSIHLITSLYSSKDAPFPPISLSLSLHPPHCLPTHPLASQSVATQQGDSSQQPGRNSQHCQASKHAYMQCTRTQIYPNQQRKTRPRQAFYDGKELARYNLLLCSHLVILSDHSPFSEEINAVRA